MDLSIKGGNYVVGRRGQYGRKQKLKLNLKMLM
jgi:hypothetical protein